MYVGKINVPFELFTPLEPEAPIFANTRQTFRLVPGKGGGEGRLPSNSNLYSRFMGSDQSFDLRTGEFLQKFRWRQGSYRRFGKIRDIAGDDVLAGGGCGNSGYYRILKIL
jgi:hypothetical protein